jgi:phosphoenolpyruvate---glycerone phosphotransferase subunit DhaK
VKKFINNVADTLTETLDGFVAAHPDIVVLGPNHKFVRRKILVKNKVALVSGGGSGHEPMHIGFVGKGMLDAACVGPIFTSPSPDQIIAAVQSVDAGAGILLIVKNYDGDRMNFEIANEELNQEVGIVIVSDDVGVDANGASRGVAGTLVVEKILGAAAEQFWPLDKLVDLGRKVNDRTRSMGVALTSGTAPAVGHPTFNIAEDEIELGVGIHGEAGQKRIKHRVANEIAAEMIRALTYGKNSGAEVLLVVNGFGGTPLMELYIMLNSCVAMLAQNGIKVLRSLAGNYVTSLDMAGCSVTITELDDELLKLWDAPIYTPTLRWGGNL